MVRVRSDRLIGPVWFDWSGSVGRVGLFCFGWSGSVTLFRLDMVRLIEPVWLSRQVADLAGQVGQVWFGRPDSGSRSACLGRSGSACSGFGLTGLVGWYGSGWAGLVVLIRFGPSGSTYLRCHPTRSTGPRGGVFRGTIRHWTRVIWQLLHNLCQQYSSAVPYYKMAGEASTKWRDIANTIWERRRNLAIITPSSECKSFSVTFLFPHNKRADDSVNSI